MRSTGPGVHPHLAVKVPVSGEDLLLKLVLLLADDPSAVHYNVSDGRAIERKYQQRQKIFG
jgi:hypothetical protein